MMIERIHGSYLLRYDPVFIAHLVELKRAELGEFRAAPKRKPRGRK